MISKISFLLVFLILISFQTSTTQIEAQEVKTHQVIKARELSKTPRINIDYGKIPLYFIPNKGQVDGNALFYAKTSQYILWMTKEGLVFDSIKKTAKETQIQKSKMDFENHQTPFAIDYSSSYKRDVSRLIFLNTNNNMEIVPVDMTAHRVNYFIGNEKSMWKRNIPTSKAVLYKEIYRNIDLKVYGIERQIEYDWVVKPGGSPEDIRFEYKNIKGTRIDMEGKLAIKTEFGELIHKKPLSYQVIEGKKIEIGVEFKKTRKNTYGFRVQKFNTDYELIIDPLIYSTYIGGSLDDCGYGIAVDGSRNTYITGYTYSSDFPTTTGAYDGDFNGGDYDVFITKVNSTGTDLLYSTFLGGSGREMGNGIAIDGSGNAYVTGWTDSTDYPTTSGAYDTEYHGGQYDIFVTKLNSSGNDLEYSTYLGTSYGIDHADASYGIAVDGSGNAYITGQSYVLTYIGGVMLKYRRVLVTKLNSTGTGELYSKLLGGYNDDSEGYGYGIAVDGSGNAYVTGYTSSLDFPTTSGAYDTDLIDITDAFLTKIDSTGALLYSTYLGGWGYEQGDGIAVDGSGNAYVTGHTTSTDFPTTTGAYDTSHNGDSDVFITKIDPAGNGINDLLYSTFLGGSDNYDYGFGIAVDLEGAVYVTGGTWSTDFPTTVGGYDTSSNGELDAFLSKISFQATLTISTSTGGTTDPSPGAYNYDFDTAVTITATADSGYEFVGWTGDVPSGHENDNPLTITMDANKSITANFAIVTPPFISLSTSILNFGATTAGYKTSDQNFRISNTGGGILDWSISDNAGWLSCTPTSGTGNADVTVSCDPSGLSAGTYNATITVSSSNASNSPQTINVTLSVMSSTASAQPFGSFDTPADGTTGITGAIPVTGWVLDDVEATKVEIWRDPVGGEPTAANGLVYIGDAVFVEGARPDVEQLYPDYPLCSRAGWGYMILTNFLPNQGNGTYVIHALAYDKEGNSVELGTKTITCDNVNAVKPFGAIDTPAQGGEASGSVYVNFGWTLTPQPNYIPEDGSTIWVYIDSVPIGHPVYNNYREDIATLFPGYSNTNGAVGYFYIDTTSYENGVHTIAWSVEDSGGNTEGIGSRYFMILNTEGMSAAQTGAGGQRVNLDTKLSLEFVERLAPSFEPIRVRRGYARDEDPDRLEAEPSRVEAEAEIMDVDYYGAINIEIREVERVEIDLGEGVDYRGYHVVGEQLRSLPIGSTLNAKNGIFSWQPGPGFIGAYEFVFIKKAKNGVASKIRIRVKIKPKCDIY